MKKQIQSIRFFIIASLLFTGLSTTANTSFISNNHLNAEENFYCFYNPVTYSWTAQSNATNYLFKLVNVDTQQVYQLETTSTTASLSNVPTGTYALTVTASYANQFSSIIVVDVINH